MKVFIQTFCFWEDTYILGTFSTKEKALECAELHKKEHKSNFNNTGSYLVQAFELDSMTGEWE